MNCPFKGKGRDSLPCEATPELRRASECPDCIAMYLMEKLSARMKKDASRRTEQ